MKAELYTDSDRTMASCAVKMNYIFLNFIIQQEYVTWIKWGNNQCQPLYLQEEKFNFNFLLQGVLKFYWEGSCQTKRNKMKVLRGLFAYQCTGLTHINGKQKPWMASKISMLLIEEYPKCVLSCFPIVLQQTQIFIL